MSCKICAVAFNSRANKIKCSNNLCASSYHMECIGLSKPSSVSLSLPVVRVYYKSCDADVISPALENLQSSLDNGLDELKRSLNKRLAGLEEGLKAVARRGNISDSLLEPLSDIEEAIKSSEGRLEKVEKALNGIDITDLGDKIDDIMSKMEGLGAISYVPDLNGSTGNHFDVDPFSLGSKTVVDSGTQTETLRRKKRPAPQPPINDATPLASTSAEPDYNYIFITKLPASMRVKNLKERLMTITGRTSDDFYINKATPSNIKSPKYLQYIIRSPKDCCDLITDKKNWAPEVLVNLSRPTSTISKKPADGTKNTRKSPIAKITSSNKVSSKQQLGSNKSKAKVINNNNNKKSESDHVNESAFSVPFPQQISNLSPLAHPFLWNGLHPSLFSPWAMNQWMSQALLQKEG